MRGTSGISLNQSGFRRSCRIISSLQLLTPPPPNTPPPPPPLMVYFIHVVIWGFSRQTLVYPLLSVLENLNALLNLAKMPKSGPGGKSPAGIPLFLEEVFFPHLVGQNTWLGAPGPGWGSAPGPGSGLLCFRVVFVEKTLCKTASSLFMQCSHMPAHVHANTIGIK